MYGIFYDSIGLEGIGKHDAQTIIWLYGPGFMTFSVGIFKWVPKADGRNKKPSKAVLRLVFDETFTKEECKEIVKQHIEQLNSGGKFPKVKRVRQKHLI